MRFLSKDEIDSFLSQRNYDIRLSHNARWIDQKCTPDVISIIADCIVNYVVEKGNDFFSSMDIWHNDYTVEYVESIFKKPNPDETKARNEYDKFFQQPMELMAYAGVLEKKKDKNRNFYRIANEDIMEYLSLRDRNALTFLQCYITKVLTDSGLIGLFNGFFNNTSKENFENLKESYEDFIIAHTPINGRTECRRIFTKVINPLAFLHGTEGTEKGRLSKHKITKISINKDLTKYMSAKAKKIVRIYNDQFRDGITEVTYDKQHIGDMATHIHHIFPEADYPTICHYIENLIALTPTQHLNYAHPNGNTQKINREYQHICLLAKSDTIRDDIEHHTEPIYSFEKFLYVLFIGLERDSFSQIENGDYDGLVTAINLAYSA